MLYIFLIQTKLQVLYVSFGGIVSRYILNMQIMHFFILVQLN
jgi:hypothetical protein